MKIARFNAREKESKVFLISHVGRRPQHPGQQVAGSNLVEIFIPFSFSFLDQLFFV